MLSHHRSRRFPSASPLRGLRRADIGRASSIALDHIRNPQSVAISQEACTLQRGDPPFSRAALDQVVEKTLQVFSLKVVRNQIPELQKVLFVVGLWRIPNREEQRAR